MDYTKKGYPYSSLSTRGPRWVREQGQNPGEAARELPWRGSLSRVCDGAGFERLVQFFGASRRPGWFCEAGFATHAEPGF